MITSQQWFDYAAALKAYEKEVRKYARKLKKYEEEVQLQSLEDGGDPPKPPVKGFDTPPVPPTPIVP